MREPQAPTPVTMADLLNRPSFQESLERAKEIRARAMVAETENDYAPPDKPLHQYTIEELDEAVAHCTNCGGFGYVRPATDLWDENFGKMEHCPACRVYQREKRLREQLKRMEPLIERYTMLKGDLLSKTFQNYQFGKEGTPEHLARHESWHAVRQWAAAIYYQRPTLKPWVYLHGKTGNGKTHLGAAAANGLRRVNMSVIFSTLPELLGMISTNNYRDREPAIRALQEIPILIIDDIREDELRLDWVRSILFRILDSRYVNLLPTMLISNLTLHRDDGTLSIADFEPRLASRIGDKGLTLIVTHTAPDYRVSGL